MDEKIVNNSLIIKLREYGVEEDVLEKRVETYFKTIKGLELCGAKIEPIHFEDFFRDLLPVVESKGKEYDAEDREHDVEAAEKARRQRGRDVIKQLKEKLKNG